MSEDMLEEIDDRRHARTDRSRWIREAIQARLDAEDRGEWEAYRPPPDESEKDVETASAQN